jgi:hypothetical protein
VSFAENLRASPFNKDLSVEDRIRELQYVERNPRPIDDDYINVFPDLLCQSCLYAH